MEIDCSAASGPLLVPSSSRSRLPRYLLNRSINWLIIEWFLLSFLLCFRLFIYSNNSFFLYLFDSVPSLSSDEMIPGTENEISLISLYSEGQRWIIHGNYHWFTIVWECWIIPKHNWEFQQLESRRILYIYMCMSLKKKPPSLPPRNSNSPPQFYGTSKDWIESQNNLEESSCSIFRSSRTS